MRIELRHVYLRYGDKEPLWRDLHFALEAGEFALVHGPSGCGKSSLLRLLNRLQEPTAGEILFDGRPAAGFEVTHLRASLSLVPQTPVMVAGSVRDNLLYPLRFKVHRHRPAPAPAALRRQLDQLLLQEVELTDEAASLSAGQQQRLALLRALLTEPRVLLCDEPTSALDARAGEAVEEMLERACAERGIGVVLVTHLDFVPRRVRARRYLARAGQLREVI